GLECIGHSLGAILTDARVISACGCRPEETLSAVRLRRRDPRKRLSTVWTGAPRWRREYARRSIRGRLPRRPCGGGSLRLPHVHLRSWLRPGIRWRSDPRGRRRQFRGPLSSKASIPCDQGETADAPSQEEARHRPGPRWQPSFPPDGPNFGHCRVGRRKPHRSDYRAGRFGGEDDRKRRIESPRPCARRTRRHVYDPSRCRSDERRDLAPRPPFPVGPSNQFSCAPSAPPLVVAGPRRGARDELAADAIGFWRSARDEDRGVGTRVARRRSRADSSYDGPGSPLFKRRTSIHVISGGSTSICQRRAMSSPVWWACSNVTCRRASRRGWGRVFHSGCTPRSRSLSVSLARHRFSFAMIFSRYPRRASIDWTSSKSFSRMTVPADAPCALTFSQPSCTERLWWKMFFNDSCVASRFFRSSSSGSFARASQ